MASLISLSELLQRSCLKLGRKMCYVTTATGGSGTGGTGTYTATDTKQGSDYADDDWNQGTLFVVRDAAGASALPEGEFSQITDSAYVNPTYTWTIEALTGNPVAAGDTIMCVSPRVPKYILIQKANEVLDAFGTIPLVDTSITTVVTDTSTTCL
jgi:hypothetical protein